MAGRRLTYSRAFLIILLVLALGLLVLIISPFSTGLFLAAVVAGALMRPNKWLRARLWNQKQLAAGILVLGVLLALVLPLGAMTAALVRQTLEGINFIRTTVEGQGAHKLVSRLPVSFQLSAEKLLRGLPTDESQLVAYFGGQGGRAADALGGILSATSRAVLQLTFMLVGLFFLLTDGRELLYWLNDVVPLKEGQFLDLMKEFRRVSVAVLLSIFATAGVQALMAFIGFLIAGVPNAFFFSLVTFFAAFIPAVGATGTSVLLALLLFFDGRVGHGIFLVLWGALIVGGSDNFVKPLFIGSQGLALHPAVVFFSLLGGLAIFGYIGIIAGPLIVTFSLALIRMMEREFTPEHAPPPVT
jgi:predicted PurR-regulated permease PerM